MEEGGEEDEEKEDEDDDEEEEEGPPLKRSKHSDDINHPSTSRPRAAHLGESSNQASSRALVTKPSGGGAEGSSKGNDVLSIK